MELQDRTLEALVRRSPLSPTEMLSTSFCTLMSLIGFDSFFSDAWFNSSQPIKKESAINTSFTRNINYTTKKRKVNCERTIWDSGCEKTPAGKGKLESKEITEDAAAKYINPSVSRVLNCKITSNEMTTLPSWLQPTPRFPHVTNRFLISVFIRFGADMLVRLDL